MLEADAPTIVEDAGPGSAGEALNRYATELADRWLTTASTETNAGVFERDVDVPAWDDLFAPLEAERDRLVGLGVAVTVDPLPDA